MIEGQMPCAKAQDILIHFRHQDFRLGTQMQQWSMMSPYDYSSEVMSACGWIHVILVWLGSYGMTQQTSHGIESDKPMDSFVFIAATYHIL